MQGLFIFNHVQKFSSFFKHIILKFTNSSFFSTRKNALKFQKNICWGIQFKPLLKNNLHLDCAIHATQRNIASLSGQGIGKNTIWLIVVKSKIILQVYYWYCNFSGKSFENGHDFSFWN